jgi:hypothetical protein
MIAAIIDKNRNRIEYLEVFLDSVGYQQMLLLTLSRLNPVDISENEYIF